MQIKQFIKNKKQTNPNCDLVTDIRLANSNNWSKIQKNWELCIRKPYNKTYTTGQKF